LELLGDYDPYEVGFRVLDTDYENYLLVYHCFQHEAEDVVASDDGPTDIMKQVSLARQHLANYVKTRFLEDGRYTEF